MRGNNEFKELSLKEIDRRKTIENKHYKYILNLVYGKKKEKIGIKEKKAIYLEFLYKLFDVYVYKDINSDYYHVFYADKPKKINRKFR